VEASFAVNTKNFNPSNTKRESMTESLRTNEVGNLPSLPNLSALLREIEVDHILGDNDGVGPARLAVIEAIGEYHPKRFCLGKALASYKECFVAERGWMAVVKAIAKAADLDERTIRRIVEDFQRVKGIPATVIEELKKCKIDPAAKKNEPIIAKLLEMPIGSIEANPEAAVNSAMELAKKPSNRATNSSGDASTPTSEEVRRVAIRTKIRAALAGVPIESKLTEVLLAIEGELLAWGVSDPIAIVLTPRASSPVVDTSEQSQETVAGVREAA
jgi:hypothetical protein